MKTTANAAHAAARADRAAQAAGVGQQRRGRQISIASGAMIISALALE